MKRFLSLFFAVCLLSSIFSFTYADDEIISEPKYYYVDPSAPDGGLGSETKPFNSIEKAIEMLREKLNIIEIPEGGICIVLAEGEYRFSETLVFSSADSGKDGKYVTYRGDGNVTFVLGDVGTLQSGNIIRVENAEYLAFENIKFKENLNASLLSVRGNNIKVKDCTFSDSTFTKTDLTEDNYFALYGKGSNISIENSEFFNVEGGAMLECEDVNFSNSENRIHNCYLHDLSISPSFSVPAVKINGTGDEVTHCEIDSTLSSAIVFEGSSNIIQNNTIRNSVDIESEGAICALGGFTTYGNIIENNFVDSCGSTAVSLGDGVSGTKVSGNVLKDCELGIYLGGGRNTEITSNLLLSVTKSASKGILYDSSFREKILSEAEIIDEEDIPEEDNGFAKVLGILSERYSELNELNFDLSIEDKPSLYDPSWYFNPAESLISNNAFYVSRESDPMSIEIIGDKVNGIPYQIRYGSIYSNVMMPRGDFSDFPKMKWNNFSLKESAALFGVLADFKDISFEEIGRLGLEPVMYFTDVNESDWFYSSVLYAFSNRLMSGTNKDGTVFSPYTVTTRAMLIQMLYNLEGNPEVAYSDTFTDVKETDWYADAVMWAYKNGITTGTGDGRFDPNASVTREQIAVFLYRFISEYKSETQDISGNLDSFTDKDDVSPYAGFTEAVTWAVGKGIISGKNELGVIRLAPRDVVQRCETAAVIARFHEGLVK